MYRQVLGVRAVKKFWASRIGARTRKGVAILPNTGRACSITRVGRPTSQQFAKRSVIPNLGHEKRHQRYTERGNRNPER